MVGGDAPCLLCLQLLTALLIYGYATCSYICRELDWVCVTMAVDKSEHLAMKLRQHFNNLAGN